MFSRKEDETMRFSIDIHYPIERIDLSRKRVQARGEFNYIDRVPVRFCLAPRYFAPIFGVDYGAFLKDVETQYYLQLQFAKYRIENIPEDYCTSTTIFVAPYFDNVVNADAFGAEIDWSDNETPRALPLIRDVSDVDSFEVPHPSAGLWGRLLEWGYRMKEFADETEITIGGQEARVEVSPPAIGGEGPHMIAVDLVGEDFYWWMAEYPEACHKRLNKITQGLMSAEANFRLVDPRPRGAFGLAEDSAQIMSSEMFKQFCVPYDAALYEAFGSGLRDGRGMHMCGNSIHLHKALKEDARITSFNLFGYLVPPGIAAENLGGEVYLWGNINPMLMLDGTKEEVRQTAMQCIDALGPCGGFMLGDGANVCPGTPIDNLAALMEASEQYGLPATRRSHS